MYKTLNIQIKRIYEVPSESDGYRVLVDRIWPRGVSKIKAKLDEWNKEVAPSTELRKWFDHKESRFDAFSRLYRDELIPKEKELNRLRKMAKTQTVSLLYGAKDPKINHAVILKNVLLKQS